MGRLDAPQPLGYSCAGVVEALGEGALGFARGDRVACAGAGWAMLCWAGMVWLQHRGRVEGESRENGP